MLSRRLRSLVVVLCSVAVAGVLALPVIVVIDLALFETAPADQSVLTKPPEALFSQYTGLEWPATATIVSTGDGHSGLFNNEGEFHLVFDTDRATLDEWLAGLPPWQQSQWKRGPVPTEIGFHCNFGSDGVAAVSHDGKTSEYSGDPQLVQRLGSNRIWYAAQERGCKSLRWHNGSLLVIDLKNHRGWLSVWDF
jgi:hypothetical protein